MRYKFNTLLAVSLTALFSASSLAADKVMPEKNDSAKIEQSAIAPKHVVELFTSQGCSSCPPANKFVSEISDQEGVLALTYGVTYWDYLGWKDTFGDPSFTKRQREYRNILGTANIYTPQIVLNGAKHSPRYSEKDVLKAELPENSAQSRIVLQDGELRVEGDAPKGATIALVSYLPGMHDVDVKRGENRGRNLQLTNVVTHVKKMPWDGKAIATNIKAETGMAYAALFHSPKNGKIISVATYAP